jgi:hypothetical protein
MTRSCSGGWREVYRSLGVDPHGHKPDDSDRENGPRSGEGQRGRSPDYDDTRDYERSD